MTTDFTQATYYAAEPPSWARDPHNEGCAVQCDHCGAWEVAVRPGETQCDNCGDGSRFPTFTPYPAQPAKQPRKRRSLHRKMGR